MSTTIADRYTEGTDGQSVVLTIVDGAGTPIDGSAITEVICRLVSEDAGTVIIDDEDCTPGEPGSRGSLNGDDELVITFLASDMQAVGTREIQKRRLSVRVTHSDDDLVINTEVTFELVNLQGIPFA